MPKSVKKQKKIKIPNQHKVIYKILMKYRKEINKLIHGKTKKQQKKILDKIKNDFLFLDKDMTNDLFIKKLSTSKSDYIKNIGKIRSGHTTNCKCKECHKLSKKKTKKKTIKIKKPSKSSLKIYKLRQELLKNILKILGKDIKKNNKIIEKLILNLDYLSLNKIKSGSKIDDVKKVIDPLGVGNWGRRKLAELTGSDVNGIVGHIGDILGTVTSFAGEAMLLGEATHTLFPGGNIDHFVNDTILGNLDGCPNTGYTHYTGMPLLTPTDFITHNPSVWQP